jgi:hypothetical protein
METLENFIETHKPKQFRAEPFYCAESDSLTFYLKDERYYGERIDDFLTVYRSMSDHGLIGCQVKGLPTALETLGNFGLTIDDKKIKLSMIFLALSAVTQAPSQHFYFELGKATANIEIPKSLRSYQASTAPELCA